MWGLLGCSSEPQAQPAFYHWQTELDLGAAEAHALDEYGAERLYVKYFDVDRPGPRREAQFLAPLIVKSGNWTQQTEIVPCVFITNRTFQHSFPEDVKRLAHQIGDQVLKLHQQFPGKQLQEVQMDCDWSPSTQEPYFLFLESLKSKLDSLDIQLSATIRLHQYKFAEETGVPPVDRGMLMVYNIGRLNDPEETNSIFDPETMRSYILPKRDYALPLDVALPIFGWTVVRRYGKVVALLNNVRIDTLDRHPQVQKTAPNQVEVTESHYFYGHYLYRGDQLRAESVHEATLLEAAQFLQEQLPTNPGRHIVLYHLDSLNLKYYAEDTIQAVFDAFH